MLNFYKNLSYVLVIVGALNWGLVGYLNFDLVAYIFGPMSVFSKLIYELVGIAAVMSIITVYASAKKT